MRELRMIVFQDAEAISALVEAKMRARAALPAGTITSISKTADYGVQVALHVTADDGRKESVVFEPQEVAAALVGYCLQRNIRMPKSSRKIVTIVGNELVLQLQVADPVLPKKRTVIRRPAAAPTDE